MIRSDPGALYMVDKCSTTEPHPQPTVGFILEGGFELGKSGVKPQREDESG